MNGKEYYIAKTIYGLEPFLADEIREIGGSEINSLTRSVGFYADKKSLYAVNFNSRYATRVLKPIAEFKTLNEDMLYKSVREIDWSRYMTVKQTLAIESVINHSKISNSLFASQRTKDAIADQFRKKKGKRPSVDRTNPDIRLNLHINKDIATLSLDSSGDPLSRRGYRISAGQAPLNEVLAAGIITQSGWDRRIPLLDPMCGSGTIVLEAALMAKNIAPGLIGRRYCFMNWPDYDAKLMKKVKTEAENRIIEIDTIICRGSDIDRKIINEAKSNCGRALVDDIVSFRPYDFFKLPPPKQPGMIIMNPPYGERMKRDSLDSFYRDIGDKLKTDFQGWSAFVFTGNLSAPKTVGLRPSAKIKMFNGPLECRLLKYEMYSGSRKRKYNS